MDKSGWTAERGSLRPGSGRSHGPEATPWNAPARERTLCAMRKTAVVVSGALLASLAGTSLLADDGPPKGATSARPTAESGFAEIRKAAAAKDDATLAARLPSALVKDWPEEALGDGAKWRAALAERLAGGEVVRVKESGDDAIARWKTAAPAAVWEMRLRLADGKWVASSPWAWCVGGGELAKANGKGAAHVKLKARQDPKAYGPSAFSFVHVTQDPKQCLNRMDVVFCRCGQFHGRDGAMFSQLKAKSLDELDGIQTGGDWMDEIVPKKGAVYVLSCASAGRRDFQVGLLVTDLGEGAIEFDWRLLAAGKNAPASIRTAQPLVSNDGADGTDQICGPRKK